MAGDAFQPPRSADEAWQLLVGTWSYIVATGNSRSVSSVGFTPDRKMIRKSSLTGGVMPVPITNERTSVVSGVAVKDGAILLTMGRNALGFDGVMTIRLLTRDQLQIEDGPAYTRDK
jgi:hypothetical protein